MTSIVIMAAMAFAPTDEKIVGDTRDYAKGAVVKFKEGKEDEARKVAVKHGFKVVSVVGRTVKLDMLLIRASKPFEDQLEQHAALRKLAAESCILRIEPNLGFSKKK